MYIIIQKKELAEAVHAAARFASKQQATLPVLGCVVIVAGEGGIHLRATNLETGIDTVLPGEVKTHGVVAVPARIFEEFVSSLGTEGPVALEKKGDTLSITAGKVRSILKTMPYEDFPTLPFPSQDSGSFSVPGSTARGLITAVLPCASVSTVRPELASVNLYAEGGTLIAAATDSFRLAEKRAGVKTGSPFSALIPAKNAADIVSVLRDDADVTLAAAEHQLALYQQGRIVTTRLVSASYPDYRQIIPKQSVAEATVLRRDFEQALKKISVFADTFQKVRMVFAPKKKMLSLSSRNADTGEAVEDIAGALSGEDMELSFNFRYLQAALPSIVSESIIIAASGAGRATVVRGSGDASFLYIVMPMNQ